MKKLIAMALSFWVFSASAQELVEFENGQVANADDINSNFQALKEAVQGIEINNEASAEVLRQHLDSINERLDLLETVSFSDCGPLR